MDEEMQRWIAANLYADTRTLRLRYGSSDSVKAEAILQIECRRKAASKLRETLRNPAFRFPTALSAEQATSDLLAGFHATLARKGDRILDLTCGLGIDAFHFASVASGVDAVEMNHTVAQAARENAAVLGLDNFSVTAADCADVLADLPPESYNLVFIDPARRGEKGERLFALSDCSPDVVALLPAISRVAPRLIIKASPMLDLSRVMSEIPSIRHIWLTGTPSECKEILLEADLSGNAPCPAHPEISSVTLSGDGSLPPSVWSFRFDEASASREEESVGVSPAELPGMVVAEPYPAVMKSGATHLLTRDFPAFRKLHRATHLFAASEPDRSFPGRCYRIREVFPFSSSVCRMLAGRKMKINVTARNFPMAAPSLVKKLHISEGGTDRLFAVTVPAGPVIIIASPPGNDD